MIAIGLKYASIEAPGVSGGGSPALRWLFIARSRASLPTLPSRLPALVRASSFALSSEESFWAGGLGRSRVKAVSSRMDSKIKRMGEVGAEAALSFRYFGLSLSSGF